VASRFLNAPRSDQLELAAFLAMLKADICSWSIMNVLLVEIPRHVGAAVFMYDDSSDALERSFKFWNSKL